MNLLEREKEKKGVRAAKESTFMFGDKGDGRLGCPRDTAAVRTPTAPTHTHPLTSENKRTARTLSYLTLIWHRVRELGTHNACVVITKRNQNIALL
jgi:hypothetical protein